MSKGVYIHGTNGSGKTTLARCLMICAGPAQYECTVGNAPMTGVLRPGKPDLMLVGKYRSATGGFDTVQPFADGVQAAITRGGDPDFQNPIVMESLVTPGVDTCIALARGIGDVTFFWLDAPLDLCIAQMNERRARRGSEPLEDVSNVEKKAASVASWYRRLSEAGLKVERGPWAYVYRRCKEILNLTEPSMQELLS